MTPTRRADHAADMAAVHTVVDEGLALQAHYRERRPQEKNEENKALPAGMLLWGMLRAVAECPECPGVFRVPYHADGTVGTMSDWGDYLVCPQCRGQWKWQEPTEQPKPKRRRSR